MSKLTLLAACSLLVCVAHARAEILLADDFEAYSFDNLEAFRAAWIPTGSSGGVSLTGGKVVYVPSNGGYRSQRSFTEFMPNPQEDLEISFRIYVYQAARQYIELIDGDASSSGQLLQLGVTNMPLPTDEWAVSMLGSLEANALVPMDPPVPDRVRGQSFELRAVIHRETETTASAKVYVNDVLGKSLSGFALRSYDTVRIGSNAPTTIPVTFDDVLVRTVAVPEPATLGAGLLAGMTLLRRRRRPV